MRKEIKHHIFTAIAYEFSGGIFEYTIMELDIYIQRNSLVFNQARVHPNDVPHIFELINQCLKELNTCQ